MKHNLAYYARRVHDLGLRATLTTTLKHVKHAYFSWRWRSKAHKGTAQHTWRSIAQKHNLAPSFPLFFDKLVQHNFIATITQDPLWLEVLPPSCSDPALLHHHAQQATRHCFDLLGSGAQSFSSTTLPWHHDYKLAATTSPKTWTSSFYRDINVGSTYNPDDTDYKPDVKVPWELSRLQHIFYLGSAYQLAQAVGDQKSMITYKNAFHDHVDHWITHNPFMIGINWKCPMDVAIRAINLIWGFYFFCSDQSIPITLWEKLVCSLYDHWFYLENNWETSDRPNNHYLADLIGALYLSLFFVNIKNIYQKLSHYQKIMLKQFNHQIMSDGTSYEGSTAYHRLVTEIVIHTMLLYKAQGINIPEQLTKTYHDMISFIQSCTTSNNDLVMIGDNDSGKIVAGISIAKLTTLLQNHQSPQTTSYKDFGITIVSNHSIHATIRTSTFNERQPTGHFHQDDLSITLYVDGIAVLVDPGTYVYTAQHHMRNTLRATSSHNNIFLGSLDENVVKLNQSDPFKLARQSHGWTANIDHRRGLAIITDYTDAYAHLHNLRVHRRLIIDTTQNILTFDDWFSKLQDTHDAKVMAHWFLNFGPCIELIKQNNSWIIRTDQHFIGTLESTLDWKLEEGWYAEAYGQLTKTKKLVACAVAVPDTAMTTQFRKTV